MAVTHQSTTTLISNATAVSLTHTITTGTTDNVLYVCMGADQTGALNPTMTYALSTLTIVATNATTGRAMWVGRCIAPATGANQLVVSGGPGVSIMLIASGYNGVSQTTPNDTASVFNTAGATSFTTTVVSQATNVVLAWMCANNASPVTHGANQTSRASVTATGGGAFLTLSEEAGAASAAVTISWATSNAAACIIFDVNSATAASGASGTLFTSGVFGLRELIIPLLAFALPFLGRGGG